MVLLIGFDVIKIGMLGIEEIIKCVGEVYEVFNV